MRHSSKAVGSKELGPGKVLLLNAFLNTFVVMFSLLVYQSTHAPFSNAGEKSKPEAAMPSLESTPDAHSRPAVLCPDAALSSLIGIIPASTVQSKYIFCTLTSLR
jgi:hypothetical protein